MVIVTGHQPKTIQRFSELPRFALDWLQHLGQQTAGMPKIEREHRQNDHLSVEHSYAVRSQRRHG